MPKPIWLLDVDGVLNALPWRADGKTAPPAWPDYVLGRAKPQDDSERAPEDGYHITYSPTLIQRIRELHESGRVEVRWLTTWGAGVYNGLTDMLGLPNDWEVVGECPSRVGFQTINSPAGQRVWWKLPLAQQVREENPDRPIIWTDDDLVHFKPAIEWGREAGNIAMIAPPDESGITPAQLEFIESFIAELEGQKPAVA